jgi:hypothetical protein
MPILPFCPDQAFSQQIDDGRPEGRRFDIQVAFREDVVDSSVISRNYLIS